MYQADRGNYKTNESIGQQFTHSCLGRLIILGAIAAILAIIASFTVPGEQKMKREMIDNIRQCILVNDSVNTDEFDDFFNNISFIFTHAKKEIDPEAKANFYKLNTLHLHLNDNEICKDPQADWSTKYAAFRLESSTYPELTAKDGSYSKAEFRDFMHYARTRGVTVVPEIDVPAHSLAFTRIRPDFASREYGADHFDLAKQDEILAWLEPLFAEYLTGADPVFAGPYCHVGTDEYNKAAAEDFRKFTDAMFKMVRKYGYKACAWGSLSHARGETPVIADRDIYMDIWSNHFYQPEDAIAAGYSIVSIPDGWVYIVPKAGYYYDYLNLPFLFNNWEPNVIGDKVLPEDCEQIVGGKYALWNDLLDAATLEDVEKRISYAMPVMAQKLWSGKVREQTFEEFELLSYRLRP